MLRLASGAFKNHLVTEMLEQPLKFFVVFFVVVEPVSLIPLFSSLTVGAAPQYKRRMAFKAVIVASAILLLFAIGGAPFLGLMGISLGAFRIFGGLLLFLLALDPTEQQRLADESRGLDITMDVLPRLVRTRAVVNETLRLYPPAFAVARESIGPDRLGDFDLPANTVVRGGYGIYELPSIGFITNGAASKYSTTASFTAQNGGATPY